MQQIPMTIDEAQNTKLWNAYDFKYLVFIYR